MKRYKKYIPYIRKIKKTDTFKSLFDQFKPDRDKKYVMVQRGCKGIIMSGRSKISIKKRICGVGSFREFQLQTKRIANGK